jgi:hypothetical protein
MCHSSDVTHLKNLRDGYNHISSRCGCSYDQVKFAKHICILKCIDINSITEWVASDKQNYSLVQCVNILMCTALLNVEEDIDVSIMYLEDAYSCDLSGLDSIIDDYRKWYILLKEI